MISKFRTIRAQSPSQQETVLKPRRRTQQRIRRACLSAALLMTMATLSQSVHAIGGSETKFKRIPTQFIAALGDPAASAGSGAQLWGVWPLDPGPRGVRLNRFEHLKAAGGLAPARWRFDEKDWWLEEHGLIMEQPNFPLPPGQYRVTGDREMTAVLTIYPTDKNGDRRWELDKGARLHDVTHLACRSARYTPAAGEGSCSPAKAQQAAFPVAPGAVMPPVAGCKKQDYAVLFVTGVALED